MKLSEAIRLGSLLVEHPKGGAANTCAMAMAHLAVGNIEAAATNQMYAYHELEKTWPWLKEAHVDCPKCRWEMWQTEVIWHVFDRHVCGEKDMTIEQLADWVASIEPQAEECTNGVADPVTHSERAEVFNL